MSHIANTTNIFARKQLEIDFKYISPSEKTDREI